MRTCDIVMKGGITSGIVYPRAVSRLAREYRFHSIGGTSAGAIAAALSAAAEYRRFRGESVFDKLAEIPAWLGKPSPEAKGSNLYNLFQAQPGMKGLFQIAAAGLARDWTAAAAALWMELLAGLAAGAAIGFVSSSIVAGLATAMLAMLVAIPVGLLFRILALPRHRFGLCTGYSQPRRGWPVSLTEWLNNTINDFGGHPPERPLTFGDLNGAGIELQMITTAVTFGRPYTLPFRSGEFYFDPEELRLYFPETVVRWMEDHAAEYASHGETVDTAGLKPLPAANDLPIIFAARLSLSFPILFCPVPLYAVDWTRRRRKPGEPTPAKRVPGDALTAEERRRPERVWFADGGISSNFPLHLFDSPLPRWPTFGLDLRERRADRPESSVWMPTTNRSGVAHYWTRIPETHAGLLAWLAGIFSSAQNWTDNLQTMVPGYRDRLSHIYLRKDQGGLNLNMPEETIRAIAEYGDAAADLLIDHFVKGTDHGEPTEMNWENHRWIRLRSTLATLQGFLHCFAPVDPSLELIDNPPKSYPLTDEQKFEAKGLVDRFGAMGEDMMEYDFAGNAPKPMPALRIRPQF